MNLKYHIAAFYRFVELETIEKFADDLKSFCREREIRGTIILASEGINGTVCGDSGSLEALKSMLGHGKGAALEWKLSVSDELPFARLKVKIKDEIISLGVADLSPNRRTGEHVGPRRWNNLLRDSDTIVLDTRNSYEIALGTFPGSVDPNTRTFRQFPEFVEDELDPNKHRKVAMFCTGGIRCEKAAAYLLDQGFESVYQLRGGILRYLEEVDVEDNCWDGECFVFDERLTVDRMLQPGGHAPCGNCHLPVLPKEQESPLYEPGISCPKCHASLTPTRRNSLNERRRQNELRAMRAESKGAES